MIHAFIRAIAACALATLAFASLAQQAPAPAPAASAAAVPKHSCVKPGEYPGNLASDAQRRGWQKDFVAYIDCLKKFVEEQQALADPHVKAANAAVNEYNAGVKDYNAQIEKAKGN
jgi:hypothetical protein